MSCSEYNDNQETTGRKTCHRTRSHREQNATDDDTPRENLRPCVLFVEQQATADQGEWHGGIEKYWLQHCTHNIINGSLQFWYHNLVALFRKGSSIAGEEVCP
eukprot:m.418337 g.418337  ORF g.418337 m.418337 type:complete len:103 (-) comp21291_c0_seq2:1027-1335(-)